MARKTTTVVEEGAPIDDGVTTIYTTDDETPDELAIEGLISEFTGGDNISVNVYRQGEGANNIAFLFKTTPQEMTGGDIMERVRDKFGSGDYRVHFRDNEKIVANRGFSVEAPKEPEAPAPGNNNMEILAIMQASNDRMLAMFQTTMASFAEAFKGQQNNAPAFDPIAAQNSMIQSVAALKGMAEPKDNSPKAMEMFVQGVTLAKDLAGGDAEKNSTDVLLKGLEMFGPAIASASQNLPGMTSPGNPPGNLSAPNPTGPPQPTGDAQADADAQREYEMGIQKVMLTQQLHWLVKQAASGKDPELYAELLLDQVGEEKVLQFVGQENALQQLTMLVPEVQIHAAWFEALRAAILDLTAPDDAGENDSISGDVIPAGETDAIPEPSNDGTVSESAHGDSGDTPNT